MAVNLKGKVAIVTGASGGIGKATALALADQGVKVGLGARRGAELAEVVRLIKDKGGEAIAVKTDVTVRDQVKNLASETVATFGPIDILVNNAGVWRYTLMKNLKEDAWEEMVDINVKGVLNGIGAVLESMVERKTGHIVNISSDSGKKPFPGLSVYGGTKFFVEGLSACMRQEVVKYGIRITNIQPGDVDTPGAHESFEAEADDMYGTSSHVKVLEAEDIARAVVYAVTQPKYCAVNEVLIQPQANPL